MQSYRFQAEVLTPLVIAGADNKTPNVLAEGLRPPSLRGVMRWWYRAMMGGIVGAHDNYKTLHSLEGKIFGATDQGSSVCFRTYPLNGVKPDKAHLCMNDKRTSQQSGDKNYAEIQKTALAPVGTFLIQLSSRGESHGEIRLALSSLWLTAMLGGLGNRSRRGFGSLALSSEDSNTAKAIQHLDLDFSYPEKPLADIATYLENGLKQVHSFFTRYAPAISPPPPAEFFVLSKPQAKLWIVKPQKNFWKTWSDAMDDLREWIYRDYKKTKGLPEIGSAKPGSRLASPLIIQIKRAGQDKYFGMLLAFEHDTYFGKGWVDLVNFLATLTSYKYEEVRLP